MVSWRRQGGGGVAAGPWNRLAVAFATTTALLATLAAWGWLRPPVIPEPGVPTRAAVSGMDMDAAGGWRLAISPDGRSFLKVENGAIHIRSSEDPVWRQLRNTEGGGRSYLFAQRAVGRLPCWPRDLESLH